MFSAKHHNEATEGRSIILMRVELDSERKHVPKQGTEFGEMPKRDGGKAHVRLNE